MLQDSSYSKSKILEVFSDCNVGGKDGTSKSSSSEEEENKDKVTSVAVTFDIEKHCESICKGALSAKDEMSKRELNNDLILSCKNVCKLSRDYIYTTSKRVSDVRTKQKQIFDPESGITHDIDSKYTIIKYIGPQSIDTAKTDKDPKIYLYIDLDNEIKNIKLDGSYNNIIYTCGHRIIVLDPTFPNMFLMSPHSVEGGNANEIVADEDITKDKPTLTANLIKNFNYAGIYDFDHDSYVKEQKLPGNDLDLANFINLIKGKKKPENYNEVYDNIKKIDNDKNNPYKSSWGENTINSEWDNNTSIYHPCFASNDGVKMSNAAITSMIPKSDPNNKNISRDNYPYLMGCYPDWHIYNRNFLKTGITISNGDYLSISWGGNVIVGNGLTIPFVDMSIAKMIASGDEWVFDKYSYAKEYFKNFNFLRAMSTIEFENLEKLIGESGELGEKPHDDTSQICNNKSIYDRLGTNSKVWYGLNGTIIRSISNDPNATTNGDKVTFNCKTTSISPDRYMFSGYINGISNKTPLNIRHYIPNESEVEKNLYRNSIISGGYQVKIEWGGCPIRDGEGLEYALGNKDTDPAKISHWKKMDSTKLNSSGYTFAPKQDNDPGDSFDENYDYKKYTKVFFRVNLGHMDNEAEPTTTAPDGAYYLKISELLDGSDGHKEWWDLTKQIAMIIFETLIGDIDIAYNRPDIKPDGALIQIADGIATNLAPIVQVFLTLYMSMIGIGFISGAIKMNQKEFVGIMLKISLVLMMFSDSGRDWFIENYVRLFIVGVMKLALKMQNLIYTILDENPNKNPDDVFNLFSFYKLSWYIMKLSFTKKIIALGTSSVGGFFIAIVVVIATFVSCLVVLKAIFAYISAMITQGILLLVAPIFFMLNLFKITSSMFQEWTKQVMGFALIPIAISITVTLFFLMITVGMEACMGFTYCLGCMVSFLGQCVIGSYYTLNSIFIPTNENFTLPFGVLSGALTFIIIAYAGWYAVEIAVGLMLRLTTFRFETYGQDNDMSGIGLSAVTSFAKSSYGIAAGAAGNVTSRKLNPIKSWKVWRKDSWDFTDFGTKDIDIALRDEKKLDEIGKRLKDLDR